MLILPSQLMKFESLNDKSVKLTFGTQELNPEQLGEMGQALQRFGWLAFQDDPFKSEEKGFLENLESDYEDTGKSPAQRLRAVLYLNWKQKPEGYEDFNRYYDFRMNKIVEHFKTKLDD